MILALLLMQAAAAIPEKPADPFATLKGTVVDAIRDCGTSKFGDIRVCSRDRGFAEDKGNRLPKLVKPKPLPKDPAITVQVTPGTPPSPSVRLLPGG